MLIIRDARGNVRGRLELTVPNAIGLAKSRLGPGWTIWLMKPVMRTIRDATQTLHHKDKVSRVRGKVACARVGGQHSSVLVHKVATGEWRGERVW